MSIRDSLNQRPTVAIGAAVAVLAAAAVAIVWQARGPRQPELPVPNHLYFSDDDGETWFADDAGKAPPFTDARGKEAFRAVVCRCGDGKMFVGHLEAYDPEEQQKFVEAVKGGNNPAALAISAQAPPFPGGMKVKRPHDPSWVKLRPGDQAAERQFRDIVMRAKCPDASGRDARPVWPE